jgi:hypothetical protein
VQRAIRPRLLLEHATDHRVRARPSRGDGSSTRWKVQVSHVSLYASLDI